MADRAHLLRIYLEDHMAGAILGTQLARRAARNNEGTPLGRDLEQLAGEVEEDKATLQGLMDHLGVGGSTLKNLGASVGERVARLKLNGSLIGYSPLSKLVELEGLCGGVETKLNLWRSLQVAMPPEQLPDGLDVQVMIDRASDQRRRLEDHRQDAARSALGA